MANPYTRYGAKKKDEDEYDEVESYGTKSTGKVERSNPYTSFGYKSKDTVEEESIASDLKKERQATEEKSKTDKKKKEEKNWVEKAAGYVGKEIIKEGIVDPFTNTVKNIGDTVEGIDASAKRDKQTKARNENTREWSKYMGTLSDDDWDKPEVRAKLMDYQYKSDLISGKEVAEENIPAAAKAAREAAKNGKAPADPAQKFQVGPNGMLSLNENRVNPSDKTDPLGLKNPALMKPPVPGKMKAEDPYDEYRKLALSENDKKDIQEMQDIDPKKAAINAAETFLNVATLGVGTGIKAGATVGVKEIIKTGAKQGIKEGAKAAGKAAVGETGKALAGNMVKDSMVGGAYGVLQTLKYDENNEAGLDDYGRNILMGAAIGAAAPVVFKTAGHLVKGSDKVAGKAVQKGVEKVAPSKLSAEHDAMRRSLEQIGEHGVVGTLNMALNRGGRAVVYKGSDIVGNTRPGAKMIDLKDDFMSKWVTNFHPLYKELKRSDFDGRTEGAYLAAREAIGNSNRALSFAQDYIENDPSMQRITGSIASRGKDLVKTRHEFDDYAAVRSELDLVAGNKKMYSKAKMAELEGRMSKFTDNGFNDEYGDLVNFYQELNQFKLAEGLMSQKEFDDYAAEGFDYVRQQRELPEWMMDKPGGQSQGAAASIAKSGLSQKRNKFASAELLSPMETALKTAQMAHVEAYRNRAAKKVYSLLDEAGEADLVRSTDIVREKQALLSDLKSSRPIVNRLNKTVRSNQKAVNKLVNELDRLNQEGMNKRLKDQGNQPMPAFSPAGLGGEAPTAQAGKVVDAPQDDQTDLVAQLLGAIKRTDNSQARVDSKALTKGERAAREKRLTKDTAVSDGLRQDVIAEGAGTAAETTPSMLGRKDTVAFLNNLVSQDPAGIKKIRNMIESRDEKLGPLMDSLEIMNRDLHEMYAERNGMYQTARGLKTTVHKSSMTSISFLDDGVENVVRVDPDIAHAVHNWGKQQQDVMNEVLRFSNNVFKYGTTSANVGFALPNFVADQAGSAINSKNVMATHNPSNFVHSFFMVIGKPLNAEDADILRGYTSANKGQTSINQYTKRASADKMANKLVNQQSGKPEHIYTMIRHPKQAARELFDATEGVVSITEHLTRIQNYRGTQRVAEKKGIVGKLSSGSKMDKQDATRVANQAARENSVDFLEMGDYGRVVNSIIPYFNAAVQGNRVMLRNATERPVSFAAKTAALVGVPVAATTIWNTSDPDRHAIYKTIPEYVKETNFVVITPGAKWNAETKKWDGVVMMKKPPGFKEFAEPVRRFIEHKADQPDSTMSDFLKDQGGDLAGDFSTALTPIDFSDPNKFLSSVTPQLLKPTAEAILNRNFFQGEEIVRDSMQDQLPADQKYENYSQLTVHLGAMFNTSPLKVDHWIRATFGEVGTNAQNTIDRAITDDPNAVGGRSLPESITRRFVGPPGGADSEEFNTTYYDKAIPARKRASAQVTELVKAGRVNEAKRRAEEFNAGIKDRFTGFAERYGDSPNYNEEWDTKIDELVIKTSESAFKARRRQ